MFLLERKENAAVFSDDRPTDQEGFGKMKIMHRIIVAGIATCAAAGPVAAQSLMPSGPGIAAESEAERACQEALRSGSVEAMQAFQRQYGESASSCQFFAAQQNGLREQGNDITDSFAAGGGPTTATAAVQANIAEQERQAAAQPDRGTVSQDSRGKF